MPTCLQAFEHTRFPRNEIRKRSVPMPANTENFGAFLQSKREEKKITLRKMADMLGFSASAVIVYVRVS